MLDQKHITKIVSSRDSGFTDVDKEELCKLVMLKHPEVEKAGFEHSYKLGEFLALKRDGKIVSTIFIYRLRDGSRVAHLNYLSSISKGAGKRIFNFVSRKLQNEGRTLEGIPTGKGLGAIAELNKRKTMLFAAMMRGHMKHGPK
ncbi:MAG: hypothetical protein V1494_01240 [Candidatus Diapherotrites archaeon]